jgi:alkylhydroperoxidase family enzyme
MELLICRVAVLNGADYELEQHLPLFIKAGGSEASARALRSPDADCEDRALFSELECAVLQLTFEMTRAVSVSDETFERVRSALPDNRQVVELVAAIATYNMVSRFLVALGVESEVKNP